MKKYYKILNKANKITGKMSLKAKNVNDIVNAMQDENHKYIKISKIDYDKITEWFSEE